jgi:SAM-dependent methyltransferase
VEPVQIHQALRRRYVAVAEQPAGKFAYPVGRESATRLGYRSEFLDHIPPSVTDRFVGVGNPFSLGEPQAGWRVVDVGCGAGFDSQVAARWVGPGGSVLGVDMSPEMLAVARAGLAESGLTNLAFAEGRAEALPVETGWADLVISNGVLNLATCKASAFAEIARVLRPGGRFQAADLILVKDLPEDLRGDRFAWSN